MTLYLLLSTLERDNFVFQFKKKTPQVCQNSFQGARKKRLTNGCQSAPITVQQQLLLRRALLKRTVPSRKGNTKYSQSQIIVLFRPRNQYVAGQSRWGPGAKSILTLLFVHTMSASFLSSRSVGRNKYQKRPLSCVPVRAMTTPAHSLLDSATLLPLAPYATSTPYLLPL
jgi:hypothetical protein